MATKAEIQKKERKKQWARSISRAKNNKIQGILAIDPATNCGWACGNGEYGVWKILQKKNESIGMKWVRFTAILIEFIDKNDIKVIAYEAPSGRHINAVIHHAKLSAIIEKIAEERKIEYRGYNVKEIKKFATNNGNANKQMMIKAAEQYFGYKGKDDNEADAICLLNLLKSEI